MTKLIATTLSCHHCHGFEHVHNEQKENLVVVLVFILVLVLESKALLLTFWCFFYVVSLESDSDMLLYFTCYFISHNCNLLEIACILLCSALVDKTISSFNVDSMGSGVAPGKTVLYQGDVQLARCLVYTVLRNLVLCQCVKGPISIINAISSFPFFRW